MLLDQSARSVDEIWEECRRRGWLASVDVDPSIGYEVVRFMFYVGKTRGTMFFRPKNGYFAVETYDGRRVESWHDNKPKGFWFRELMRLVYKQRENEHDQAVDH